MVVIYEARVILIIFIMKHPHHSGRNVMLDLCLTVCGRSGGSARLVRFSRQHICCTDVGGNGSGGYFSAAAGRLCHIITL